MKKCIAMLMLGATILVFTSGCSNGALKNVETNVVDTPKEAMDVVQETPEVILEESSSQTEKKKEIITKAENIDYIEGLNLCSSYTLALQNESINIELYVSAEIDPSGEMMLDDGQEWALIAHVGDAIYPLLERTYIQNGQVHYTVYTDYEQNELPHIIVEMNSGASINYYDCVFDEIEKTFSREVIFEANNINALYRY